MSVKIKHIVRLAAALLLTASGACSEDPGIDGGGQLPSGAVLRLTTGSSVTRGDGSSDPYAEGEEAIGRVDLFFFENATTDKAPFYTLEIADVKRVTTADLTVKVPVEHIATFKTNDVYIHALVNLPRGVRVDEAQNTIDGRSATLANLQSLWVEEGGFVDAGVPAAFVMRGGSDELELTGEGRLALVSGTIMLERLASKVRLWAEIPEELYVDRETGKTINRADYDSEQAWQDAIADTEKVRKWQPVPTTRFADGSVEHNVKLYLYNLTTRGRLDGFLGSADETPDLGYRDVDRSDERADAVRRLVSGDDLILNEADRDDRYAYSHTTAYYSYPNAWDSSTPTEQHRTYVVLALPWRDVTDGDAGSDFENYYYQIPVNALRDSRDAKEADRLEPNRYYRIKLRVGMLGSKDLGSPLEIDASCEVADWTGADVDVRIKPSRYLVVNQKNWTMNNVSTLEIPFSSSHDVVVEACYVNYFRYNDIWGTDNDTDSSEEHASTEFTDWLYAASQKNIKDSEGEILSKSPLAWGTTGQDLTQMLYYKKEYFYDEIYAGLRKTDDADESGAYGVGFKYYVGHEHPKTFQKTLVARPPKELPQDGWDEFVTKYEMDAVYTCKVNNSTHLVTFDHPLVWWKEAYDSGSDTYYYLPEMKNGRLRDEYSRCEIIIKIRHADRPADEHLFEETIYITQYPGLYIEVSHDYGEKVPTSGSTASGNRYVLVNAHTTEADRVGTWFNSTDWNEVSSYMYYFGFINNNPNMYVIHTTQLEEDTDGIYILGDPRNLYYNNQLGIDKRYGKTEDNSLIYTGNVENPSNRWNQLRWAGTWNFLSYEAIANATRLYDGSNGPLKYYYPTDETEGAGSKESFVAPVFRIASSFGKVSLSNSYAQGLLGTNYLDRESRREARRRCAAYQEAGRPAGRWRVPTISEIEYVMQLSADNKIPHLFGLEDKNNSLYWCSTGLLSIDLTGINDPADDRTSRERITKRDGTYDIPQYTAPAVRCIYDEWYWAQVDGTDLPTPDGVLETTFYWGDRPKDNTQVQSLLRAATNKQKVIAVDE